MDVAIEKLAGFGVPSLILIVAIEATGLYGAAAITLALASIGPLGIFGGLATLLIAGLASESISKYGVEQTFKMVLRKMYDNGETKESLICKIENYPITKELKWRLYETIEQM